MYVLIFILVWNYILAPLVKAITHGMTIINFDLPGDVWTLLQIGLGGYVTGRSAEAVARTIANRPTINKNE